MLIRGQYGPVTDGVMVDRSKGAPAQPLLSELSPAVLRRGTWAYFRSRDFTLPFAMALMNI